MVISTSQQIEFNDLKCYVFENYGQDDLVNVDIISTKNIIYKGVVY